MLLLVLKEKTTTTKTKRKNMADSGKLWATCKHFAAYKAYRKVHSHSFNVT